MVTEFIKRKNHCSSRTVAEEMTRHAGDWEKRQILHLSDE